MKRYAAGVMRTLLGLLCGICATLFIAQYDPWVHHHATCLFIDALEKGLHCQVQARVRSINVFKPELVLQDVRVCSHKRAEHDLWNWQAKRYITGFSWWSLFAYGVIDMTVTMEDFLLTTHVNENYQAAVGPHLMQLAQGPDLDLPLYLKSLVLHKASCIARVPHDEMVVQCSWNSESKKVNDALFSTLYITDGIITKNQKIELTQVQGAVSAHVHGIGQAMHADILWDCTGQWAAVPDQLCFLQGSWNDDHGSFSLHSMDHTLSLCPVTFAYRDSDFTFDANARIPLSVVSHLSYGSLQQYLQGDCVATMRGSLTHDCVQGDARIACSISGLSDHIITFTSTFEKNKHTVQGVLTAACADTQLVQGNWHFDQHTKKGLLRCTNAQDIPLTLPGSLPNALSWILHPHNFEFSLDGNDQCIMACYCGTAQHDILQKSVDFSGTGTCDFASGALSLEGAWKDHRYSLHANCFESQVLQNAVYSIHEKPLFSITHTQDENFESVIDVSLVRSIISTLCHYDVQGEGSLHLVLTHKNNSLTCDARLVDGTIRLPETYNFVNGFRTHISYDMQQRSCMIHDLTCELHSGVIRTKRAVICGDPRWNISFAHVPIWLDRCLLNSKKNLFATTSANLLLSKPRDGGYMLMGHIMLERSQLKENIFSDAFQKTLVRATQSVSSASPFDIACNLCIETKDPVRVDTDFLKVNAQAHIMMTHSIMDPVVSGDVTILSGTLKFPYKPLHINRGTIRFIPDQPMNPSVEILAKNTIKNHRVSLQVTGSLSDHMIMLESTPPLTQEQIVGLLLAGAHDESLTAIIPALLMQNITNVVLSSGEKTGLVGVWDRHVKPWIKRFNVNFVPRLSDQTGRGGLRGILEMSVNERWRALIEKNFSLTEDTRFELEYLLSDDITFRLIRDERYDIGGEVEMRWKF